MTHKRKKQSPKSKAEKSTANSIPSPSALPVVSHGWQRGILVALVLLPVCVYGRSVTFDFVNYDDWQYVSHNERIWEGLNVENIVWAFKTDTLSNWHPLTWISYMIDAEIYGRQAGGFHATNLLLHIANTLLLYLVLKRMTASIWPSAFVAAVFSIHPLHVESVAWIAERKDVLSIFFGLPAIGAYVRYVQESKRKWYWISLAFFLLSLMSKQTLVTLPCLLLLLDFWPLRRTAQGATGSLPASAAAGHRSWPRLVFEKLPFFLMSVVFSVAIYLAQGDAVKAADELPVGLRLMNAPTVYVIYLVKMFWPHNMAALHPHPVDTIPTSDVVAAVILLAAATAGAVVLYRRFPFLAVGWFWYLGTLVPMIGIVQVGVQRYAYRYTYFPLIGIYIALVWLVSTLTRRWRRRRAGLSVVAALVLASLGTAAWIQVGYWRNSVTLFTRTLAVTGDNPTAHINLGHAFEEKERFDEAIEEYRAATAIAPLYDQAHFHLGMVLLSTDRPAKAIVSLEKAVLLDPKLFLDPELFEARAKFAKAYRLVGREQASRGRLALAVRHFRRAVELIPKSSSARFNLAKALAMQGKNQEALAHFARALKRKPDYAEGHYDFGRLLLQMGIRAKGIAHLKEAVRLKPNDMEAKRELERAESQKK